MNRIFLKGNNKKRFRSILSLVLVATLVFGTLNFGSINAKAATTDRSNVTFNTDGITGSKSAINNGDGTVNINFSVTGSNATSTTPQVIDTDIVLVMDISVSMVRENNKSVERLAKAQKAAKEFVKQILTDNNKDHVKIGVASFNEFGYIDQKLTNDVTKLNTAITSLSAEGGTNIQAGIQAAESILDEDKNVNVNKIIILLSDGEPTFSYQATEIAKDSTVLNDGSKINLPTTFNSKIMGYGSSYTFEAYRIGGIKVTRSFIIGWSDWKDSKGNEYANDTVGFIKSSNLGLKQTGYVNYESVSNNGDPTISQSYIAKKKGITIYSIAYDASNNSNAVYTMKNVAASTGKYYTASSTASSSDTTSNAISNIMNAITKDVIKTIAAARGAKIVDKLPSYLTATEVTPSIGTTAVIDSDQQVTWTLGELPADTTKTLTIRATLNKAAMLTSYNKTLADLTNGAWFAMNQKAIFNYIKSDNIPVSYPIANPELQFTTQKYIVNYFEDGTPLSSSVNYQFINDRAGFGNAPAYASDSVKYNKSLTTVTSNDVTLSGTDGNWNFVMPANAVTVKVDYFKNLFTVNYYDNKSADNNGKGALLSSQIVKYGENSEYKNDVSAPSTDSLTYDSNGFRYSFSNWDKSGQNITENTDILALYGSQEIKYVAEFFANTGDIIPVESQIVKMNSAGTYLVSQSSVTPVYSGSLAEGVDHMVFDGWNFDFTTSITGDVKIYATYKPVLKTFTVQFHDMDDAKTVLTKLTISNVTYGTGVNAPAYPNVDVRTKDQVRFFTGWTNVEGNAIDLSSIKDNTDVYASYRTVPRYYTVTWDANNGVASDNQIHIGVEYGTNDSWIGSNPSKANSASGKFKYEFASWDNGFDGTVTNVTSDIMIKANYTETMNMFNYNFQYYIPNEDGSSVVLKTTEPSVVEWGSTLLVPTDFQSEIVVTVSGSGIWTTYSFDEWSNKEFETGIMSTGTATASYNKVNTYLVTFLAEDGSIVKEINVEDGKTVTASEVPDVPQKASDATNTYEDPTWGDVTIKITAPTTFTASYTPKLRDYKVIVNVYLDGSKVAALAQKPIVGHYDNVETGQYGAIVDGLNFNEKQYLFDKIEGASLEGATYSCTIKGNGEINIFFAEKPKFKVTYYKTEMVSPDGVSLDLIAQNTTSLIGYSDEVYADGALTQSFEYDGSEDAKVFKNAKNSYTFVGWVDEDGKPFTDTKVTANKNVYASFKPSINSYTVIFLDYENDPDVAYADRDYSVEVAKQTVQYGESVTIPAVPTKNRKDTEKYHYTNHSWNIAETIINPVTNDLVVKAEHSYELQKYDITFVDYDGTVIKSVKSADYGTTVAVPTEPSRQDSADGHYNYTFDQWVEVITVDGTSTTGNALSTSSIVVSGSAIYKADYTENENTFKVTFLNEDGTYFGSDAYKAEVTWGQKVTEETKAGAKVLADAAAVNKSNKLITYTFANWEMYELLDEVETKTDATIKLNDLIKKDLTVYASYLDAKNIYSITYKYENGTDLDTIKVTAGDSYTVNNSGPAKESTNTKVYAFSHWVEKIASDDSDEANKPIYEIELVDRDYILYPVYEESTRLYSVDFIDYDGTKLSNTQYVEYNKPATAPTSPTRADEYTTNRRTVYAFNGWDVDFSKIKADTTVTARYSTVVYDITPKDPVVPPTVSPTVSPVAPTPVVEDITEEIPEGTPEIPQGTPEVENGEDSLPADDTTGEVHDVAVDGIPEGTPTLPQTGTAPVGIFYGIGVACAFIGASIIISSRKKKEDEC